MHDFLHGAGIVCIYFVIAASGILFLRKMIRIPDELFRKTLHSILLVSYIPFAFAFDTWWHSVLLALIMEILIYPILAQAEHLPMFSSFVNERKQGEFKHSLIFAFTMLAVCNTVCWGLLGDRYLGLACMYAWGVGDAFAALVGKKYGRHKIKWKPADHKKSIEGSAAMFLSSAMAVFCVLMFRGNISAAACLLLAAAGAGVSTVVEMISPNGVDTITCPSAAMLTMIPLMALLGGFA